MLQQQTYDFSPAQSDIICTWVTALIRVFHVSMLLDHPQNIRPCPRRLDCIFGYFYLVYNTFSNSNSLTHNYINCTSDINSQVAFRFLWRYIHLVPQISLAMLIQVINNLHSQGLLVQYTDAYVHVYICNIYIYTYNKSEEGNVWGTEGQGPMKELNVTLVLLLHPYLGGSRVWIYWVVKVILLEHPRVKWRS